MMIFGVYSFMTKENGRPLFSAAAEKEEEEGFFSEGTPQREVFPMGFFSFFLPLPHHNTAPSRGGDSQLLNSSPPKKT